MANLIGHGDVATRSLDEVRAFCDAAWLKIEKLERAKKFRLHLVMYSAMVEPLIESIKAYCVWGRNKIYTFYTT